MIFIVSCSALINQLFICLFVCFHSVSSMVMNRIKSIVIDKSRSSANNSNNNNNNNKGTKKKKKGSVDEVSKRNTTKREVNSSRNSGADSILNTNTDMNGDMHVASTTSMMMTTLASTRPVLKMLSLMPDIILTEIMLCPSSMEVLQGVTIQLCSALSLRKDVHQQTDGEDIDSSNDIDSSSALLVVQSIVDLLMRWNELFQQIPTTARSNSNCSCNRNRNDSAGAGAGGGSSGTDNSNQDDSNSNKNNSNSKGYPNSLQFSIIIMTGRGEDYNDDYYNRRNKNSYYNEMEGESQPSLQTLSRYSYSPSMQFVAAIVKLSFDRCISSSNHSNNNSNSISNSNSYEDRKSVV